MSQKDPQEIMERAVRLVREVVRRSRRILGWRAAPSMRTDLVLDQLESANWTRTRAVVGDLTGVVAHHDAGSQCTSIRYTERLVEAGAAPSVGSVSDAYDNPSTRGRSACSRDEVGTLERVDWQAPAPP